MSTVTSSMMKRVSVTQTCCKTVESTIDCHPNFIKELPSINFTTRSMTVCIPYCDTRIIFSKIDNSNLSYTFCGEDRSDIISFNKEKEFEFSNDPTYFLDNLNFNNFDLTVKVCPVNTRDSNRSIEYDKFSLDFVFLYETIPFSRIRVTNLDKTRPVCECIRVKKDEEDLWIDVHKYPYGIFKFVFIKKNKMIIKTNNTCITFRPNNPHSIIENSEQYLINYQGRRLASYRVNHNKITLIFDQCEEVTISLNFNTPYNWIDTKETFF